MSLYRLTFAPLRSLLLAWLLLVQFGCVLSEAYAATFSDTAHDIHHVHALFAVDDSLGVSDTGHQFTYNAQSTQTENMEQRESTTEYSGHGCEHCQHCHAGHLGLFKAAAAPAASHTVLSVAYQHPFPSCIKANIYRPPIT